MDFDYLDSVLKDKHLSRRKLALAVGIKESTMSTAFQRKSGLNAEGIAKIAGCLGIDVHRLIGVQARNSETMTLDPLLDPLKDNAVVPERYVATLKRQGWVKVVRCKDCWKLGYDNCPMDDFLDSHPMKPDFFCAAGEPEDKRPRGECGPDYCDI